LRYQFRLAGALPQRVGFRGREDNYGTIDGGHTNAANAPNVMKATRVTPTRIAFIDGGPDGLALVVLHLRRALRPFSSR
jgi:hypothetical protein